MLYQKIKAGKGYISVLAPMEGVTDTVFRQVLCDIGKPDLFFTEFLNVEGFCSRGREEVMHRLKFSEKEKPIVVQLWGNVPEFYAKTVEYVKTLNPNGIDINIGCSVRDVLSKGRGSALIKDKELVRDIVEAVKSEAGDIPVSVKTRMGYDKIDVEGWIGFLLTLNLDLITIHGRLSKEGYSTPSRWEEMVECVRLRDEISPTTFLIGNGDIKTKKQGEEYVKRYGLDGFMVARAILTNPWFFTEEKGSHLEDDLDGVSVQERIDILIKHLELFKATWGDSKPFNSQKKYIKVYVNNFKGANELRKELMETEATKEAIKVLDNFC